MPVPCWRQSKNIHFGCGTLQILKIVELLRFALTPEIGHPPGRLRHLLHRRNKVHQMSPLEDFEILASTMPKRLKPKEIEAVVSN